METKHTPGPWLLHFIGVELGNGFIDVESESGRRIYCREVYASDVEEKLANARLIAAAPELLEALKMVVRANNECIEGGFLNHNEAVQINEAITKAEGLE